MFLRLFLHLCSRCFNHMQLNVNSDYDFDFSLRLMKIEIDMLQLYFSILVYNDISCNKLCL